MSGSCDTAEQGDALVDFCEVSHAADCVIVNKQAYVPEVPQTARTADTAYYDTCRWERMNMAMNDKNVNETELYDLAELFKIFGDSTRIRILFSLFNNDEVSVGELAESLNMTISAISHQLRILKHNKLIKSRREGKLSLYSLDDEHVRTIIGCGMEHIEER